MVVEEEESCGAVVALSYHQHVTYYSTFQNRAITENSDTSRGRPSAELAVLARHSIASTNLL